MTSVDSRVPAAKSRYAREGDGPQERSTELLLRRARDASFAVLHDLLQETSIYTPWVLVLIAWEFIQVLAVPLSQSPSMPWRDMPL